MISEEGFLPEYNLFLDDIRFPNEVSWIKLPDVKWVIVRNYEKFVLEITTRSYLPKIISYDHDLADSHCPTQINEIPNYDSYKEKTGYHCAKWLVDYCLNNKKEHPEYYVHSMNPIGKENIEKLIEGYKKFVDNNG